MLDLLLMLLCVCPYLYGFYALRRTPYAIRRTQYTIRRASYAVCHTSDAIRRTPYDLCHTCQVRVADDANDMTA